MKRIIDVDEDYYKAICRRVERFGKGSVILPTPEKIIFNGIPFEDIKVEIQNTILEQTYEKGQIDVLEKIKGELIAKCNHCNCESCVFASLKDEKCLMKTIINNCISELKGENKPTCDRNICLNNEYNNIGCEDCIVTKGE